MASNQSDGRKIPFDINALVGLVLGAGVLTCILLLASGFAWQWMRTGRPGLDYTLPRENLVRFISGELRSALRKEIGPIDLVNLGISVLLLTPSLRVLLSLLYFAFVARNYKYAVITGFVCSVLTYTLFLR